MQLNSTLDTLMKMANKKKEKEGEGKKIGKTSKTNLTWHK